MTPPRPIEVGDRVRHGKRAVYVVTSTFGTWAQLRNERTGRKSEDALWYLEHIEEATP